MDFKVVFKQTFIDDLGRIVQSVAAHNPEAAKELGERILVAAESLNFFPERHPRVRQRPAIRRFIVKKNFKVFYRVHLGSKSVEILRCWDARQEGDPPL
jgi:plasmid stabilization system protein ParE